MDAEEGAVREPILYWQRYEVSRVPIYCWVNRESLPSIPHTICVLNPGPPVPLANTLTSQSQCLTTSPKEGSCNGSMVVDVLLGEVG